jgi:hypothetical protein
MKRMSSQSTASSLCFLSAFSAPFHGVIAAAVGLLILAASAAAGDEENDAEVRRLQGRFERTFKNDAGTTFRIVKDVVGNHSTVTTYDDADNVVAAHTSSFKVEKRGSVRVFSFFNLLVTAGQAKGHQQLETRSYLYRTDDETFTEAWGLLEGDPSPPRMAVWKRVK